MNKKVLHVITIGMIVLFAVLAVASMESTPSSYSSGGGSSSSSGGGYSSGSSSSSSETGKSYTVINKSSYDVTLSDSGGSTTIASGQTSFVRFNDPVASVRYYPDDKVAVGLSGDTLVFTNK
jgi:hypothetical protein